ncbi:MAG: protochlorophyllide oxidoreductase [Chlorobiaceae bacterium]|nr:protochlorophyllide oxidoreductase [Chlorobiaceae bacterium]
MTKNESRPMKAVILYDSMSVGGSTDRFIDAVGLELAKSGAYVEKARCRQNGDYSFIDEFDVVVMGAPIYYLLVSSQLFGALSKSNLKQHLKGKMVALFVACGSPEPMARLLYLPQLKMNLEKPVILAERVLSPDQLNDPATASDFVVEIVGSYQKAPKP